MRESESLVIVGGGPAALATARAYRAAGGRARVAILSDEPHPPYRRPPLTKGYLRGEVGRSALLIEPPGWYGENGVDLRLNTRAASLDAGRAVVETESGEELGYDACVLATGSEPVRPPVPGGDDPEVLVMRTLQDSSRLRERAGIRHGRAVVVGSGFIGCEAAASLSLRGVGVTLISLEDLPQSARLGQEVGRRIESWLRGYGIRLLLGESVEAVERTGSSYRVSVGGGRIASDTVLLGTGVEPRTGLARAAGLRVDKGVVADSRMRASAPGVFAVGDAAEAFNESAGRHVSVEHWGDALEHGRIAGTVIAGGETSWRMAPGFWSTIGDETLKYRAWGDGWDEVRFAERRSGAFTAWYGAEGATVGVLTHDSDDDYERGRELVERGAPLPR